MKNFFYLISAVAVFLYGCSKEETAPRQTASPAPQHNIVNITVTAGKDAFAADGETKVTYDGDKSFAFEPDDCLQLSVAKVVDGLINRKNVVLPQVEGKSGVFSGQVDLGTLSPADIHSAYIVKSEETRYNATTNSGLTGTALRFNVPTQQSQWQPEAGVFDGAPRVPFWTVITSSMIHVDGSNVTIDDLTLTMTAALFEFHVYGEVFQDEKIRSIALSTDNSGTHFLAGSAYKNTTGGQAQYSNDGWGATVSLVSPGSVAPGADQAPAIYMAIYPQTSATVLTKIVVKTDKATYTKSLGNKSQPRATNKVYPFRVNLATFTRSAHAEGVEYSTDGGTTWLSSLPDVTDATKLAVRGHNLTEANLASVRTFLDSQAESVDVDMSDAVYESNIFPKVFGNGTAANACKKIKTFMIPENITELASECFRNSSITKVDMPRLITVGDNAFRGCGSITSISLPQAVTLKQYAFSAAAGVQSAYLPKVERLEQYALFNKSNANFIALELPKVTFIGNYAIGSCTKLKIVNVPNLTTIGAAGTNSYAFTGCTALKSLYLPKVKVFGHYAFNGCTALTDLYFGPDVTSLGSLACQDCTSLARVTCMAATPPVFSGATKGIAAKANSTSEEKVIYVPASSLSNYQGNVNWTAQASDGWTIEAASGSVNSI